MTYENSAEAITIQTCMNLYEQGIAVVIDEGKHVTFVAEE